MESSRDQTAKPATARKKKSVEQHLKKRKALADKNELASFSVHHGISTTSGKENKDQQASSLLNIAALKERNCNEIQSKKVSIAKYLVSCEKLQNLPITTYKHGDNTSDNNVQEANAPSVQHKDSTSLRQENESSGGGKVSIVCSKSNLQDENVCDYRTRREQWEKNNRTFDICEHLEKFLYVEDYKKDIVQYLMEREKALCLKNVPKCSQFAKLHAVIVNWLTKLLSDLRLRDELLFITITLLDRLFTKIYIPVNKLQLAAIACLWIAIKLNGNTDVLASEIISTCKVAASVKELIVMEQILLSRLNFDITVIEPLLFINYYLNEMKIRERKIQQICKYLLDIILLDSRYSTIYPSLVGSAAVYSALLICGRQALWIAMQQCKEFHKLPQFSHISDTMLNELKMICLDQAKFRAAYNKHRKLINGKISRDLVVVQNKIVLL